MEERQRIQNMVREGKITADEAERLLAVLSEIDEADASLEDTARSVEREAEQVERTGAPEWAGELRGAVEAAGRAAGQAVSGVGATMSEIGRAVFGGAAATDAAGAAEAGPGTATGTYDGGCAPEGTRWLHVTLVAGDLTVRADPSVTEPVLSGATERVKLEPTADGFRIGAVGPGSPGDWVGPFFAQLSKMDLDVRLPPDLGLDVRMTAGELTLEGVPFLRGKLTAGDIDAKGLRGIDFTTAAGDVDVELRPQEGRHRLQASAGDVKVRLLPGSDVTVSGVVSIGDASVAGSGFSSERRGLGRRLQGTLGAATATLELKVTTGDLDVRAPDA